MGGAPPSLPLSVAAVRGETAPGGNRMRKEVILVTGAAGEMGQALIARLADERR